MINFSKLVQDFCVLSALLLHEKKLSAENANEIVVAFSEKMCKFLSDNYNPRPSFNENSGSLKNSMYGGIRESMLDLKSVRALWLQAVARDPEDGILKNAALMNLCAFILNGMCQIAQDIGNKYNEYQESLYRCQLRRHRI